MFNRLQAEQTIAIRTRKCLNRFSVINNVLCRDRPKRLFLVTAVTETGAEIQLLVSAVTVTETETTIMLTVKVTVTIIQATN